MKSRWTPQGRDYLGQDVTAEAAPRFFLQTLVGVFWFWSKGLEFSNGKAIFGEADESPGLFVADRDEVGAAFDFGSQGGSDAQSELNGPVGKCFPSFPLSSFFSFRGALPKVFPSALRGQIQSWGVFFPFPCTDKDLPGGGSKSTADPPPPELGTAKCLCQNNSWSSNPTGLIPWMWRVRKSSTRLIFL